MDLTVTGIGDSLLLINNLITCQTEHRGTPIILNHNFQWI